MSDNNTMNSLLLEWIRTIQGKRSSQALSQAKPSWDVSRFAESLKKYSKPYSITNYSTFDYSACNNYEVNVPITDSHDKYPRLILSVRISFIIDAFCLHWTRYESNQRAQVLSETPKDDATFVEEKVRSFLISQGFMEVPDEWMDVHIPNVHLELSRDSEVTLSKCLFDDYY
jgi:hypothetical protein